MTEDQQTLVNMVKKDISHELMNLAIKFICLLTGENCAVVMKTSVEDKTEISLEPESAGVKERQSPLTVHPLPFITLEGQTKKKILEVTRNIIELVTDEVPIRFQDVTVYFSMEEWVYLEEHQDLYKDVMMEDEPDGSRKRNPPQRCPRPRDSTQEDLPIPTHNQCEEQIHMKVEFKEEEEVCVNDNHPTAEKNEMMMAIKKEDSSSDISTNGSRKRNPPQRCPGPQGEDLNYIKEEIKEEETSVYNKVGMVIQSNPEGCSSDIKTERQHVENSLEGRCSVSSYVKDDSLACSPQEVYPDIHYRFPETFNPEESREHSNSESASLNHEGHLTESWKTFAERSQMVTHQNSNKSRHHLCPECGKSFSKKGNFHRHLRIHKSERPYSCLDCGKCFTQKEYLVRHQRTHTGEYPFSCSDCGKCFTRREYLVRHQRTHTGERPFSCSECGKHFLFKTQLVSHIRVHTGERPFIH